MALLIGSFIAGLLTVLAPCVLPLLPVIIGGSVSGNTHNTKRPFIITASLAISLIVFTLALKVSTLFIDIPPQTFIYISGAIVIALGLLILFPDFYSRVMVKIGIEQKSQQLLGQQAPQKSVWSAIITGAALGPVFSSCSPVYAYILATVLPASIGQAFIYIISYVLGLSFMLLVIGLFGQKAIRRVKFAANPRGLFQRTLAVIFIVVGVLIMTGYDKRVQTWVSAHTIFNFDAISAQLIPANGQPIADGQLFNVQAYPAPELTNLQAWINSQPTSLKQLRGKVVLIDFWTYSCINCIRANPYNEAWYKKYKDAGLVVLGIHAPEFAFEQKLNNVQQAVKDQGITYPVALDNNFSTWNAYHNQYWPAHYLIDAEGQVRRIHNGEGEYNQTEQAIRQLLLQNGATLPDSMVTTGAEQVPVTVFQTPETYLGTSRSSNYSGQPALAADDQSIFTAAKNLSKNHWTLGGTWQTSSEYITAKNNSTLTFRVSAKDVYLVAGSSSPQTISVKLNGQPIGQTTFSGPDVKDSQATIQEYKLYHLASFTKFTSDATIELSVPSGVQLNVFTFGG